MIQENMMDEFKVIIAGGRDFNDFPRLCNIMDKLLEGQRETLNILVISGGARGADTLGEKYARLRGFKILRIKADWDRHGKSAGFVRNNEMLQVAQGVVCFWNKRSRGTRHMIDIATKANKPLRIINY